ncbi:MAG: ABC transporter ATP-binding protein, partial [Variovorax sp.]|nr:ABC transporter ATP-binding protein [Variovorax sp.]
MKAWRELRSALCLFFAAEPKRLAMGAALAALTVLMGMALLGLSGWFITATALAGLNAVSAIRFDVFMPSAGIRLLALGRTASRYGERLVTHDATFGVLASLRERLFRGWAAPGATRQLLARPSRLLFRLTADIDALEALYLRLVVPAGAALAAAVFAGVVLGAMSAWMGALLALWLIAAGWGIAAMVAMRARGPAVRRAQAMEALRARAVDLVAGQTELVMAGRIDGQRELLAAADRHLAEADMALNRLETGAGAAYGIAGTLALAAVLLAVGWLAGKGAIGVPGAALALLVAMTAMEPFAALRRGALEAARAGLAARRLAPRWTP